MMGECEVSVLSEISKIEEKGLLVLSSNQDEKQTVNEEENENSVINMKQTVDEEVNDDSVINTQNESEDESSEEEKNVDVDWMNEYPPLVSRGVQVCSANSVVEKARSTTSWVDALKKPHCPFDAKVNGEKLDISTEESVVSSEGCSRVNLLDVKVNGEKLDISSDSQEESVASSEVCSTDELVVDKANGLSTQASACSFFSIKIPRFDDEVLKEQIRLAELHVDETTDLRDSIRLQMERRIQEKGYEHAVDQVRSAQELVKLKRKEMDSHLSMIRTVRNALPFDDMDIDCQEAFGQQMLAEEHLKTLKKELETLKASVMKAESAAAVAQKQSNDKEREVKHLEARLRAANEACQAAYAQIRSLRAQQQEKMRQFYRYLDEANGKNQMDKFMQVWNKNNKFRQDYVKSNAKSTVRRFGTLDGRALGPGEKPIVLPRHVVPVVKKENREKLADKDDGLDIRRQEAEADLKEDVSIEKAEETERKEQKVEAEMGAELKAEKREKKRQKRLRLRERKKALAAARDGFSLDPTPVLLSANQRVDREASTHYDLVSQIASLELEQENEDEMLKKIETHEKQNDEALEFEETHENQNEALEIEQENENENETRDNQNEASPSLNVQQQTELLELQGNGEAQLREKRRNKKMTKKERKKAMAAAATARDNNKMKWIFIVFITITLLLCLTNMDLQLLRQFLH